MTWINLENGLEIWVVKDLQYLEILRWLTVPGSIKTFTARGHSTEAANLSCTIDMSIDIDYSDIWTVWMNMYTFTDLDLGYIESSKYFVVLYISVCHLIPLCIGGVFKNIVSCEFNPLVKSPVFPAVILVSFAVFICVYVYRFPSGPYFMRGIAHHLSDLRMCCSIPNRIVEVSFKQHCQVLKLM